MTLKATPLVLCCVATLAACSHNPKATESGAQEAAPTSAPTSDNVKPPSAGKTESSGSSEIPATRPKVRTALIQATTLERTVSAYGTVAGGANEQASLAFPLPGRIAHIAVNVGDRVAAGEVLAQLDPTPFEAEVNEASANVQAAEANLEKTRLASRPQQIASTDAQVTQAKTQLAIASAQLARQQRLVKLGISAQTELEAAMTSVSNAHAQLEVLEQQLSTQQQPWKPDVDASRAAVAQAHAALSAARDRLSRATLTAPFAGTVSARLHNDGETVDPTAPVVQITNEHPPAFTAQFSPEDAAKIHVGALATVVLQGANVQTNGIVSARNVAQSTSRTIPIVIRLTTTSSDFGPGAYGTARIAIGSRSGLVVPAVCIVSDATTGATQIFRKDGDRYTPVPVDVVDRENGRALIVGFGLHRGQTVAAEGADELVVPPQTPKKDAD